MRCLRIWMDPKYSEKKLARCIRAYAHIPKGIRCPASDFFFVLCVDGVCVVWSLHLGVPERFHHPPCDVSMP